jgi:nicotinate-nucleotide--dimethylbenzimidazole phosphoribosyltransferase
MDFSLARLFSCPFMTLPIISPTFDPALSHRLDQAIANKTKPLGSLGLLEKIAHQIGMIQRTDTPHIIAPSILIFAADHGIVAEHISAYPQSVTWQMIENFLQGNAAINIFAKQNGCQLHIIDAGVNHDFGPRAGLLDHKIAYGTENFALQAAMTTAQCQEAISNGLSIVATLEADVIGFGEMGIGNTTAAAAIMHAMTGLPLASCVGAGTGLSPTGITHKAAVIERSLLCHVDLNTPLKILATFGGFEIAMMVGAMLQAAAQRKVLLIDGFIVTSALLIAARLQPAILDYCIFSHCSDEAGHRAMLTYLDATPLMQLGLRLGEGTGCALVMPLLNASVNFLNQMATFASADVSNCTS